MNFSSSSPRVLIDLERMRHPCTGLSYYCSSLVRSLAMTPTRLAWSYYACAEQGRRHYPFGYWHRYVNLAPLWSDVVHVTHQLQVYLPQTWHKPCVVTLHDLNFLFEDLSERRRHKRYMIVKRNLERADIIVCISHFVRTCLLENLSLFSLKEGVEIQVVYNGVELPTWAYNPLPTLPAFDGVPYYLAIGQLIVKKRQHLLVEMMKYLPEREHLVLVCGEQKAEYLTYILELVEKLNLGHRVHLCYGVSEEVKFGLLQHARALLQPSVAEGFGIPPIEAMLLGKPVFLSKYTSLPEIGGEEALYWESDEPESMAQELRQGLERCAQDPGKALRLQQWAERYSLEAMGRGYVNIYESIVDKRL